MYFSLTDVETSLLKTFADIANVLAIVVFALFGDVVDRRKLLLSVASAWFVLVVGSALVPADMFWVCDFQTLRSFSLDVSDDECSVVPPSTRPLLTCTDVLQLLRSDRYC